jgi:hypothetical protein
VLLYTLQFDQAMAFLFQLQSSIAVHVATLSSSAAAAADVTAGGAQHLFHARMLADSRSEGFGGLASSARAFRIRQWQLAASILWQETFHWTLALVELSTAAAAAAAASRPPFLRVMVPRDAEALVGEPEWSGTETASTVLSRSASASSGLATDAHPTAWSAFVHRHTMVECNGGPRTRDGGDFACTRCERMYKCSKCGDRGRAALATFAVFCHVCVPNFPLVEHVRSLFRWL